MPTPSSGRKSATGNGVSTGKANILSFFKPVAQPQPTASPVQSRSPAPASSSPLPSPIPSSPPNLPVTPTKAAPLEIGASDDDGDSDSGLSDDSLEDLSCILSRTRNGVPAEQKPQHNPYATPRAKRTSVEFHSSPLAIIPRHKFDMKALAKDARRDDATTASSLKVKEAESMKTNAKNESSFAAGDTIAGIVKDNNGHDAQKVLRAVQRSDTSQSQPRYLFFAKDYEIPPVPKAPELERHSPWNLLTQGDARSREQHLISGLPQTILRKRGGLPDSVFQWLLDSLCIQTSLIMRQEYCNMVASCPEQVERLLTADRIKVLFIHLGATDIGETGSHSKLTVSRLDHEPYEARDWSRLQSFISLLGVIAGQLSLSAADYATQSLIRLSLDKFLICNIELLAEFEYTVQQLATAIPSSRWDSFCLDTCTLLNRDINSRCIKTTSLLCLPISNKRTHDLRRRIAVTTLFQNDTLAAHNPEDFITLRSIIDILNSESFAITNKTNFSELRASIILLDIAVDDGSVVKFDDGDDEKKFNEEVDELAGKLREIWRKTNDSGMKLARTEAKSVVEWVQQRLSHSVRTRRKVRKSVFDIPGQQEDPFLPKQRDYMKKFLQKTAKSPTVEEPPPFEIDEDTIVCAGG